MVNFCLRLLLSFLFSASCLALDFKSLRTLTVKNFHGLTAASPSHAVPCQGRLWAFSIKDQGVLSLGAADSHQQELKIQNGEGLALPLDLAALSCFQGNLLLAVNARSNQERSQILTVEIPEQGPLRILERLSPPQKARMTDLFCGKNNCYVIQTAVFESRDLKKWQPVTIPSLESIKAAHSQKDLNPFEGWQERLIVAKTFYTKGAVSPSGNLAFLDPFHSTVIVRKDNDWLKWGSFGAWEGSFLNPSDVAFWGDDRIVVLDSRLKLLFFYNRYGTYLGTAAKPDGTLFSPDFSANFSIDNDKFLVPDFRSSLVFSFSMESGTENFVLESELSIRQNLFRRPEVLKDHEANRCLVCHSGVAPNQLFKFVKSPFHHPLQCSQCHDPHHTVKNRHYLKKEPNVLCMGCHKENSQPQNNHVWLTTKPGGRCTDCHYAHAESEGLVRGSAPSLCMNCHSNQKIPHRKAENLLSNERAKGLAFFEGNVACTTCHMTHKNSRQTHFLQKEEVVLNFCAACHGDKAPKLYRNFHKLMKAKGAKP